MRDVPPQLIVHHSPKLLDQARGILRAKHYSDKTEQSYIHWMKRYILFHNKRHPQEMGGKEIGRFQTHWAVNMNVAASQNQGLYILIFLCNLAIIIDRREYVAPPELRRRRDAHYQTSGVGVSTAAGENEF